MKKYLNYSLLSEDKKQNKIIQNEINKSEITDESLIIRKKKESATSSSSSDSFEYKQGPQSLNFKAFLF